MHCFATLLLVLVTVAALVSAQCVDKLNPKTGTSDCPSTAYLCNNSAYYSLMTDQCPKTCGRCSASSSTCVDKNTAFCPGSSYLCNTPQYASMMADQCAKTCKKC